MSSRLHQSLVYASSGSQRLPALSFGQSSTNKVGLSFPLGTGLVVLIILLVSALFSFCYHWLRLRKLGAAILPTPDLTHQQLQAGSDDDDKAPCKLDMLQCPPLVYMAGEDMPRFIAVPCAFEGGSGKAIADVSHEKSMPKSPDALKLDSLL